MVFPVRLQQLMVSVTEPEALAMALRNRPTAQCPLN